MYQRIVVSPGGDAVEPAFEKLELGVAELLSHVFEQHYSEGLLLHHFTAKKLIGDLKQVRQAVLSEDGAAEAFGDLAQFSRTIRAIALRA